jgi:16S rRNA (guanine527-N7)-methyltransferase
VKQIPLADAVALRIESSSVLTEDRIRELMAPFGLFLTSGQISRLSSYLDLLLTWNRRINLTSVRTPEECVTRHFGESLYLSKTHALEGRLLDVGSGAGFPGLALKLVFPDLQNTLLEPIAKKRAFLKEVARACGFTNVDVRPERVGTYRATHRGRQFDVATSRAVGDIPEICRHMASCVKIGGQISLWLSEDGAINLPSQTPEVEWREKLTIPLSKRREILSGVVGGV